jgi:membrane-associated phospholipid phosphatase
VAFSIVMGLSRAYLAAHWLSDATAGILLGTSCALVTALIVDQFQRRRNRLQRPAGTQFLAGVPRPITPRTADDRQESGPHRARHRRPQHVGPADIPE